MQDLLQAMQLPCRQILPGYTWLFVKTNAYWPFLKRGASRTANTLKSIIFPVYRET